MVEAVEAPVERPYGMLTGQVHMIWLIQVEQMVDMIHQMLQPLGFLVEAAEVPVELRYLMVEAVQEVVMEVVIFIMITLVPIVVVVELVAYKIVKIQ